LHEVAEAVLDERADRPTADNKNVSELVATKSEEHATKSSQPGFRSGFVALVGRPNAGKSTLINRLVGQRVAIVSEHPQTTRTHLLGIYNVPASDTHPAGQIVFIDTPGVHKANSPFNREMMRHVRAGLEDRNLALLLADVTRKFGEEDEYALQMAIGETKPHRTTAGIQPPAGAHVLAAQRGEHDQRKPTVLVLNKIDALPDKRALLPIIDQYRQRADFAEIVPVSALKGDNLELLVETILKYLPEGPQYFSEDQVTDQPERFLAAEIIREKALLLTREEVPHTLAVKVESWEATPRLVRISAVLYCERTGQKAILVGRGGERIKQIGTEARKELELQLSRKVFLELHVIVKEHWRKDARFISSLDWRRDLEGNPEDEAD
jgi:GTP-binding protein Era